MIVYSINNLYRKTHILNETEYETVNIYVKQKVREWINDCDTFTVRDLFGYENGDWRLTPLQIIYENYLDKYNGNEPMAYRQAAIDVGHILKLALNEMPEKFGVERINRYVLQYYLIH